LPSPIGGTAHVLKDPPHGQLIRIVDYTVTIRPRQDPPRTEIFRLATSLLNHEQVPAHQPTKMYHERREIENSYAEIKNRLRGARPAANGTLGASGAVGRLLEARAQ
jgi:hypothetical protein